MNDQQQIFANGSRTYYYSSRFFPQQQRTDITKLYAFVRIVDDFVDQVPADNQGFNNYRDLYQQAIITHHTTDPILSGLVELIQSYDISLDWFEAFWSAMESDLHHRPCQTMADTIDYMYGSAEVIGLMLATILGLPSESHPSAQMLGRAMQYANFIRDIAEDNQLHRQYIPTQKLQQFDLPDLSEQTAQQYPEQFNACIRQQITYYRDWQSQAKAGYHFIPRRYRIPIKTAADMYLWTIDQIEKNPSIVFSRKVKPSKFRILINGFKNTLT